MKKINSFANDVITLASVPLISQLLGIFLVPIVTRLYTPEAFGLFNLFGSMTMLIAVFATMGYHNSLILPKTNDEALNMLLVCIFSNIIITLLSVLIIFFGYDFILEILNAPELGSFLWLVP